MDLARIRAQEFPVTEEWRFFNHAATSPLPKRAAAAMGRRIREQVALGSLGHDIWTPEREQTRALVARFINADPAGIAFIRAPLEALP
jgi:cysteine desulfurase / selenocysteine lyase